MIRQTFDTGKSRLQDVGRGSADAFDGGQASTGIVRKAAPALFATHLLYAACHLPSAVVLTDLSPWSHAPPPASFFLFREADVR
jgi:hypothetical protein